MASALLTPASLAVIVHTFPESERGAAIGTWTAWGTIAAVLGPLIGGELLAIASWRWIFMINLPVAVACVWLIMAVIPPRAARARRRDGEWTCRGRCCARGGLGGNGVRADRAAAPRLVEPGGARVADRRASLLLFAFVLYEARASDPMLPLRLFRKRNFAAGNVETFAMYAGLAIVFFFLVLFLQQVAGYSPLASGLTTLPVTVVMFTLSRRFGALADRYGPRLFMGAGPLVVRRRAAAVPARGHRSGLPHRPAPGARAVRARAVDDGGAAHGGGARRRHRDGRGHRLGREQRDRARGRADRHRRRGCGGGGVVRRGTRRRWQGVRLGPAAQGAVAEAKRLPLGLPDVAHVPPLQAHAVTSAAEQASLHSFHVGMGIAAVLLAGGGLIGVLGVRNPRGLVAAEECPAGSSWAPGASSFSA